MGKSTSASFLILYFLSFLVNKLSPKGRDRAVLIEYPILCLISAFHFVLTSLVTPIEQLFKIQNLFQVRRNLHATKESCYIIFSNSPGGLPGPFKCWASFCLSPPAGFEQSFRGNTAADWIFSGTADLTSGDIDPVGNGWLRLTSASADEAGTATYNGQAFPSTAGVEVSFTYATYGGNGADGIGIYLIDGSVGTPTTGGSGGALGYAWNHSGSNTVPGVTKGYVGIGLDEYGNFAINSDGGPNPYGTGGIGQAAGITVRGPGNLNVSGGFPYLTHSDLDVETDSRSGVKLVVITITPAPTQTLTVSVDGVVYISNFSLAAYPMPATFKMGFSSSTGGSNNIHEIRDFVVGKAKTSTTSVVSSRTPAVLGSPVIFTATVSCTAASTPTGTVNFYDNITPIGTGTLIAGKADISTSSLKTGAHIIKAKYMGNSTCPASKDTVHQVVVAASAKSSDPIVPATGFTMGVVTKTSSPTR